MVAEVQAHPLVETLHLAFVDHRPVVLSPDAVWLTLVQGVATHIRLYAEELRGQIVDHADRQTLVVVRDDFRRGAPDNDWPGVFDAFAGHVRRSVGDLADAITASFSTTDEVSRIASQVALLGAVQSYYQFVVVTRCGIPSLTLTGTVEDWRDLRRRIESFAALGLDWWIGPLGHTLDVFVDAVERGDTTVLARDLYKWRGAIGSGSPTVSGRVVVLFPYVHNPRAQWRPAEPDFVRNPWLEDPPTLYEGPLRSSFPRRPAMVRFLWNYLGEELPMWFVGGLVGVRQSNDLALSPEIGWAVAPEPAEDPS